MHRIAVYSSLTLAHLHAAHLRAQGIMAGVLGENIANVDPLFSALNRSGYELYIATKRHADQASALLDEYGSPELPDDWERETIPDLTLLDPSLIPPCPACAAPLDPTKPLGPCAACNTPSDLAQLVLNTHGPEALVNCYTHLDSTAELTDDEIRSVPIDCIKCQTPLDGLHELQGTCPRCRHPFDRREAVAMLLSIPSGPR